MKKKYTWTAEGLELRGKYLWRDELIPMLHKHLGVRPGLIAVDVGCGSGFLTRLIAKGLQGQGKAIGVDTDEKLLRSARELAEKDSLGSLVEFKRASAYQLPFPDGFADVVACHTLLYILGKPLDALREMARVAKLHGRVVAIEPDYRGCVTYNPHDAAYDELAYRFNSALIKTFKKIYGADLCVGSKLPSLFLKTKLKQIEVHGYLLPTSPLTCENRYSIRELVDFYSKSLPGLTSWSQEERKAMEEYGISGEHFEEYVRKTAKRIRYITKKPQKMRERASMSMRSFLVVIGRKTSRTL
jgi:ubiquinone/menaquinone biosynthesis C-methylase UbiE